MKRVMIVGQPGAGKSTLAREVGRITGLPVVHVDKIHWMPGWEERPKPDKIEMALAEEAKDAWVFEGGLSATWDNRLARADTLIHVDFPVSVRMWRVFRRTLREYGRTRQDLPADCPERFSFEFWHYIWRTRHTGRERMRQLREATPATKSVHYLASPQKVQAFLAELEKINA